MTTGEFDITHWEKVGWENYGRWRQVDVMFQEAVECYKNDIAVSKTGEDLAKLRDEQSIVAFLAEAKKGRKAGHILWVLSQIRATLSAAPSSNREIPLGIAYQGYVVTSTLDEKEENFGLENFLKRSLPGHEIRVEETFKQAEHEAGLKLFELFEAETPLMFYRQDFLPVKPHARTLTGGFLAYLPTTVNNVFLKLNYERGIQVPTGSFEIRPLNQE